ncbi:MAG: T9SS type A sorting domain-containing protein [Cyclobacteriaceae bacterium]|nr:T9SS type A sorting domain-containing protein [Cyclobacteriaceae bacterium]
MPKSEIPYVILLLLLATFNLATAQQIKSMAPAGSIICYSSEKDELHHTAPPAKFLRSQFQRARIETASIVVTYKGFTPEAQAAFQYAVNIWESLIYSAMPIHITANWIQLEDKTLGSAQWGNLYSGFTGGEPDVWYPVALAEKITGQELNGTSNPDILANFNSKANWYMGLDGLTPSGTTDLVSVVLHEIGHGLGITTSFYVESSTGSWGSQGTDKPMVYDTYVMNSEIEVLTETYQRGTTNLFGQLNGQVLYFNSPIARMENDNTLPQLYAPNPFNGGSSIAHLDEATYMSGTPNSLMTPQIGWGESIHDPGPLVLSMLYEMGWISTYIEHTPLANTESVGLPFDVSAIIRSDTDIKPDQIYLHYSPDEFVKTHDSLQMQLTGLNTYLTTIPAVNNPRQISYYISAEDKYNREYSSPFLAPQYLHSFHSGPDNNPPVITHTPVEYVFDSEVGLAVKAEITDVMGIFDVNLNYSIAGVEKQIPLLLNIDEPNMYEALIDLSAVKLLQDSAITYYITAQDKSLAGNTSTNPATGWHRVAITGYQSPEVNYVSDFNMENATSDFIGSGFYIGQPEGFSNPLINSLHPYPNGSGPGNESNYFFLLRTPIILDAAKGNMQFDEIVLVEPGEEGTTFGHPEFWDYVILEGSKDQGKSWQPVIAGYDCRANATWEDLYNNNIQDNDSYKQGKPAMLKRRFIDIFENGNFLPGDTVAFRFRLFADELAHGWGWAIDNLSIQDAITAVDQNNFTHTLFKIYPNPVKNTLVIENLTGVDKPYDLIISDHLGRIIQHHTVQKNRNNANYNLDFSQFEPGVYIILLQSGGGQIVKKIIKSD